MAAVDVVPALSVEGLTVRYGAIEAVRGTSFAVSRGEVFALLGNNGAGKTSTLAAIAGLVAPRGGTVRLNGTNVTGQRSDRLVAAGLSLVPEGRRIFPRVSIRDHLVLGGGARFAKGRPDRAARSERTAIIDAAIDEQVALFPVLGRRIAAPAAALSGGEQQQLALARALMADPSVLLLDEPSLGLAPAMIDLVFSAIATLKSRGITLIVVEQNAERAVQIADRVGVMAQGALSYSGPAEELRGSRLLEDLYLGPLAADGKETR